MVKTGFCHVVKLLLTTWYFGLHTSGTNKNIILFSQGSSGQSLIMYVSRRPSPVFTGIILHAYAIRMNLVEYCCDVVWGWRGYLSPRGSEWRERLGCWRRWSSWRCTAEGCTHTSAPLDPRTEHKKEHISSYYSSREVDSGGCTKKTTF